MVAGDTLSGAPKLEAAAMEAQFEPIDWAGAGVDPCTQVEAALELPEHAEVPMMD